MVVRRARAANRLPFALVCAVLSLQASIVPALAVESKWTTENLLDARDITELSSETDSIRKIDEATIDRLLAEMWTNADFNSEANITLSRTASKALKTVLVQDDPRLQSTRYLLAESVLRRLRTGECSSELKTVLKQELDRDQKQEAKFRKNLSESEKKELGVESETSFLDRYQILAKTIRQDLPEALVYRARLLFWDGRINDSTRLLRLARYWRDIEYSGALGKKNVAGLTPQRGHTQVDVEALYQQSLNDWESYARAPSDQTMQLVEEFCTAHSGTPPFVSERDALHWQTRKKILEGIAADAAGNHGAAGESFAQAREISRKCMDVFEDLVARYYLGRNMLASSHPVTAFDELNGVYEAARRSIEGRRDGLLYRGLGLASLRAMTDCMIARIDRVRDTEYGVLPATSNGKFSCNLVEATDELSLEKYMSQAKAAAQLRSEKDYEELASNLYHTAYQYKSTGKQRQARILFWNAIAIYDKYLPSQPRLLSNALYDLAESYMWGEDYDAAIPIFTRCVDIRRRMNPNSNEYVMTLSTLGRAYMNSGKSKEAVVCLKKALHGLIHNEQLQSNKVLNLAARIRNSRRTHAGTDSGAEPDINVVATASDTDTSDGSNRGTEFYSEQLCLMPLHTQLDSVADNRRKSDPDAIPQIDDLWQVLADAYSRGKYFDEAQEVSKSLLDLRKSDRRSSKNTVLDSLWQLAYIYSVSYKPEEAKKLFSEMVREHAHESGKPLADWLYTLGVLEDSIGKPKEAAKSFSTAISQYKKEIAKLHPVKDKEQIQNIGWTIADLQYELKAKQRCPESSVDYLKAYPTSYWSKSRFPLKIFIDDSQDHGFGPVLHKRFEEGVNQWITTPGLDVSFKFVDDKEEADIYLERVSNYDQIPVGSGGGAVATFVQKGNRLTREIDRVHLRIYCPEHDAEDLANYAVEHLYTLALHEFGHALGLGHSPSGLDVMYWKSAIRKLSKRDRATLLKVYGCKGQNPG